MLQKIYHVVVAIQYQLTNAWFFVPPDPCFGRGIILEDALGNVLNISWGLVHSWEVGYITQYYTLSWQAKLTFASFSTNCSLINLRD